MSWLHWTKYGSDNWCHAIAPFLQVIYYVMKTCYDFHSQIDRTEIENIGHTIYDGFAGALSEYYWCD